MGLYRIRANLFRLGDNETITYISLTSILEVVGLCLAGATPE